VAYNLTVAELHTDIVVVGDAEVLVHNTCEQNANQLIAGGRQVSGVFPPTAGPEEVLFRTGADGTVTDFQGYDELGRPIKEVELVGRPHGGIEPLHVQEYDIHLNPANGQSYVKRGRPREALPEEIPK
jgi:hypothetical protein